MNEFYLFKIGCLAVTMAAFAIFVSVEHGVEHYQAAHHHGYRR